ncbi:macro domain-containing protein [Paenibacillus barcinonensis]|uniref:Macro domain-containing protein n=1 Tax=Paenibacillus barcinonensis TaxID=198119 RepID=A0A2V4V7Y8_PAEBA|nr:macro domain-containing protein [Paenibacillus barcinonensis]PYE48626.1 O-acetyl-ADP-ribose deacetylase (regulator of RNase III) [Paenibacillus barcinonensis]QKS58692.1 macro domain-containing protein [Paenibacillus barcinonensis]
MQFDERQQDLFELKEDYALAHCISADARMGKGIAVQFRERFDLQSLQEQAGQEPLKIGRCYPAGRTLNLVTKAKFSNKPTYISLTQAVESMRKVCEEQGITRLAMPRIGCGLDRLKWEKVSSIIQNTFADMDIEIIVCTV